MKGKLLFSQHGTVCCDVCGSVLNARDLEVMTHDKESMFPVDLKGRPDVGVICEQCEAYANLPHVQQALESIRENHMKTNAITPTCDFCGSHAVVGNCIGYRDKTCGKDYCVNCGSTQPKDDWLCKDCLAKRDAQEGRTV